MRILFAAVLLFLSAVNVSAQRLPVTANFTVYVAPPINCSPGHWGPDGPTVTACGDDVAGNGTQENPYGSCQHAVQVLFSQYDFQGMYAPTIQLASGEGGVQFSYNCAISGRLIGQPGGVPPLVVGPGKPNFNVGTYNPFIVQGDTNDIGGAFLVSNIFGFPDVAPAFSLSNGATVKLTGVTVGTGKALQDCIDVMANSYLDISNVSFGNCGAPPSSYNIGIGVAWSSTLNITGPLIVNGSMSAMIQVGQGSSVHANNNGATKNPIHFNGINFGTAAFVVDHATFYIQGLAFSGSFSGNGLLEIDNAAVNSGSGAGPRTCPASLILSKALVIEDNSVCR